MEGITLAIERARFLVYGEQMNKEDAAEKAIDEVCSTYELSQLYRMYDTNREEVIQSIVRRI